MYLQALSVGEAVPRKTFDAVVQSAFDSALNLRLVGEDRLVTLLNSERYELPQGIRIWAAGLTLQDIAPETQSALRGGVLRFEAAPLSVDLRGASVWKSRVPALGISMAAPAAWVTWGTAWDLLNAEQRRREAEIVGELLLQPGAGTALNRRIQAPLEQLLRAAGQRDLAGAVQAMGGMIGLGPGVTPSGDDVLIGILAALWASAARQPAREAFLNALAVRVVEAARQTGEISRTYLMHAARGQFSSVVSRLVEALSAGKEVEMAVEEAMRVGHSSGMDTVTGLLLGLMVSRNEDGAQL